MAKRIKQLILYYLRSNIIKVMIALSRIHRKISRLSLFSIGKYTTLIPSFQKL